MGNTHILYIITGITGLFYLKTQHLKMKVKTRACSELSYLKLKDTHMFSVRFFADIAEISSWKSK